MSDAPIVVIAGAGAALMAAAGAMDTERFALLGVGAIFVAAAWKFVKARNKRNAERRKGEDQRHDINTHPQPPMVVGSR